MYIFKMKNTPCVNNTEISWVGWSFVKKLLINHKITRFLLFDFLTNNNTPASTLHTLDVLHVEQPKTKKSKKNC